MLKWIILISIYQLSSNNNIMTNATREKFKKLNLTDKILVGDTDNRIHCPDIYHPVKSIYLSQYDHCTYASPL